MVIAALAVVFLLCVYSLMVSVPEILPPKPAVSDQAEAEVAMDRTWASAPALSKAFQKDKVLAMQKYGGKLLIVTGDVTLVDKDANGGAMVTLAGSKKIGRVNADITAQFDKRFLPKTSALKKGQTTKITCKEVEEFAGSVMLGDCAM